MSLLFTNKLRWKVVTQNANKHEGKIESIAFRFQFQDVLNALISHLGLARNSEEIHDHANCVQSNRLFDWTCNHPTEEGSWKVFAVDVCDVGAKDERRLGFSWNPLQEFGLADR